MSDPIAAVIRPPEVLDNIGVDKWTDEEVHARLHAKVFKQTPGPEEGRAAALLQGGITSSELLAKEIKPLEWLLPGLIPSEGLSILCSKMGNGKSFFLLQLAAAISTGTPFLNQPCPRGGVLLIALEDSERRLQGRMNQLNIVGTEKLLIYTRWQKGKGALEDLRLLLACKGDIRTVIIDPIVKFIDLLDFNDYGGAYGTLGPIKDALDAKGATGIFSHHAKKEVSEVDALDDILGSTGWGGACDTRMILRRIRGTDEGTLITTGRDVEFSKSAIQFGKTTGWTYEGPADDVRMSEPLRDILDLLADEGALEIKEIASRLKRNYNTTRSNVQKLIVKGKAIRDGKAISNTASAVKELTEGGEE